MLLRLLESCPWRCEDGVFGMTTPLKSGAEVGEGGVGREVRVLLLKVDRYVLQYINDNDSIPCLPV